MSISLNNHESRIKVLENKQSSMGSWEFGSNWAMESVSKLKINWGSVNTGTRGNKQVNCTFGKAFSNTSYGVVCQKRDADHSNNTPMRINSKSNTQMGIYTYGVGSMDWIAIGYLISNSIRSLLGGGLGWL